MKFTHIDETFGSNCVTEKTQVQVIQSDAGSDVQRPPGQEGSGEMQQRRHSGGSEEAHCCTDGHALGQDCAQKMVHDL
ncbi:hypothetical protein FHG87_003746 [Trinorchestia longiramus]|nr:hypothetical protein FHG87_003746 [Trinorchestia longiramus]